MEKSPAFGCRRWGFESTHFLERMIAVKDGFVRVAAATPQVSVANVEENARLLRNFLYGENPPDANALGSSGTE